MKACCNSWTSHFYHSVARFVQSNWWKNIKVPLMILYIVALYFCSHGIANYTRPCNCLYYLYLSYVLSVISLWNELPHSVKASPMSVFKAHILH